MLRTRVSVRPEARMRGIKRIIREDHGHVMDQQIDLSIRRSIDPGDLVI